MSQQPFFKNVEEFVQYSGGDHAIKKVLIANNGIGATKAIRSIRKWSFETFGDARKISFVVMATPEDMRANAEYIRMADEVVDVPGGTNNNNYANITLICEIAQRLLVDAVMPMWGHASENPALPLSLLKLPHRVTFIGPPAAPMHALGDKIGSTIIAQSAGVPVIAWNGDGLRVDYQKEGIPPSVYEEANVTSAEDALKCCERIGFPVMIKASEGGGGKGIRKVMRLEDVMNAYRQVQGEIPGSPIFVMKMASHARHLEVQLLADKYGEAIALSGRDCSVQRRHQKIIEEGPPTAASAATFRNMEKAAVSLAKTVGYCNCGTVEYLFMEDTNEFAFLELNPRLQVEHPVTENILGLNLPACQLQVAMGLPLHRIAGIRKLYGRHPMGKDTIDFDYSERVAPPRHCIAVRITAENPDSSFQPTSGLIEELNFRSAIDVWGYFSINESGLIHEFADSQFGHIFSSGPDRESARRAMLVALKELSIRGDIRTTVEYIIRLMQTDDFICNRIDTDWLDRRIARHKEITAEENVIHGLRPTLIATCGAALQGYMELVNKGKNFIDMLKVGQVPAKDTLSPVVKIDLIYENVKYMTTCIQSAPNRVCVECNGSKQDVAIRALSDGGYLLKVNGKNYCVYFKNENGGLRMILDGQTCIFTPEYDPTRLTSSVAGKIARLLVADGTHVQAGDPYVEIEVMKMYMPLKALEPGTVHFQMSEGATLSPGSVIALVKLDYPDKVVRATPFTGSLSEEDVPMSPSAKFKEGAAVILPHIVMREALTLLEKVLEGFPVTDAAIDTAFATYLESFGDKLLPSYELEEAMSVLRGRIDANLTQKILTANSEYRDQVKSGKQCEYPSGVILSALHEYMQSLPLIARAAFQNQTSEVWACAELYLYSAQVREIASLLRLTESYLNVEKLFDDMSFTDVVNQLRKEHSTDLEKVLLLCRSHVNHKSKNYLMNKVLDEMKRLPILSVIQRPTLPMGVPLRNDITLRNLKVRLTEMSKLRQGIYNHVSFGASLVLMKQYSIKPEQRRQKLHDTITLALTSGDSVGHGERATLMKRFVDSNVVIRDLLLDALRQDKEYQIAALELYLLKTYQATHIVSNFLSGHSLPVGQGEAVCAWIKFDFMTKHVEGLGLNSTKEFKVSYSNLHQLVQKTSPPTSTANEKLSSSPTHRRVDSDPLSHPIVMGVREGVIATIESGTELPVLFPLISAKIATASSTPTEHDFVNVIHIVVMTPLAPSEDETSELLSNYLKSVSTDLLSRAVRRVTFFVAPSSSASSPGVYTFRSRNEFNEDRLYRHIEAPHAFHLDLPRLANFSVSLDGIQTSFGNVFLYKAVPKSGDGLTRYFSRLVSFTPDVSNSDVESLFVEALDHLGLQLGQDASAAGGKQKLASSANHIFMSVVAPETVIQADFYEGELRRICTKYWYKMIRLSISVVELKLSCKVVIDSEAMHLRLVASNPTGFVLKIDSYYEATISGKTVFKSIGSSPGPWEGQEIVTPYPISQPFETQRAEAMASSDTLYVYDWPVLFQSAAEKSWEKHVRDRSMTHTSVPDQIFSCRELVLCSANSGNGASVTYTPLPKGWTAQQAEKEGVIVPMDREPGQNDVGMVAWLATLCTPECPAGREVVIICNDITYQAGSFGTREDVVFFKASEYARKHGLPRLFLAANSGARIGMAQSLKNKFQVCWNDPNDPSKGFRYLYLSKETYSAMLKKAGGNVSALPVICRPLEVAGEEEECYVITDIIGEEPDLGVENLMGSGLIAGETARAYDEIFTLTLVVGRTVGIGAYLVRLGQRTIQKTRNSPIILTGYQALNKLMGREIYTTNDQLGGPMIMFPNGVSHLLADTHMESVSRALAWLSYVPSKKGGPLPIQDIRGVDTIDRTIDFSPPKNLPYDPRLLLSGVSNSSDPNTAAWQSGFFDKGSFEEALAGWAKTVVVGRGRLGGIPIGVIVTENRTVEGTKPADPADLTSQEKMVQQAGGVWFPDSAYKTAQALRDFNREGLPCIIFANWRGFSGGQRDMFDEVLKFGSMIVDALVAYQQPLFVYIPPFAELRGGAWVVVDSTINSDVMEFYAAEDARGGVLEAAGAASIKFRDRDIVATAHRIDPTLMDLDSRLASSSTPSERAPIEAQIKQREKMLFGVYQQVAVHFADLHDTPGRMKSKGVIRKQVDWSSARTFFYWRLRRRLFEFAIANKISSTSGSGSTTSTTLKPGARKELIADLQRWFGEFGGGKDMWEDDRQCVQWLEKNQEPVQNYLTTKHASSLATKLQDCMSTLSDMGEDVAVSALKAALSNADAKTKKTLLAALNA